ncbi:MAG: DNA-binding transcriptional regulator [Planctomycetia bacterium]|nr:DNA-binding transcriptional regulator [Planctomycetia bacterium]
MKKKYRRVLLMIETSRGFGRGLLHGISEYVKSQKMEREWVPWQISFEERGIKEGVPEDFGRWNGEGIILRSSSPEIHKKMKEKKCAYVELLGDNREVLPEIRTDEMCTAEMAVKHFEERGLIHFGFYTYGNNWWSNIRRDMYIKILTEKKKKYFVLDYDSGGGEVTSYSGWEERYRRPLYNWLKRLPRPIGIWAASDMQAVHVLQACQELEISVPEEIAVLGTTNDTLLCNLQHPQLSSIHLNAERMGYEAARLLDKKMSSWSGDKKKKEDTGTVLEIPPVGVVTRQSTDTLAIHDQDMAEAIHFIRGNYMHDISVGDVADEISLSRSTLDRHFRMWFGHSVKSEISRLRMELAKKLLRETEISVAEVSRKIGFRRTEYFIRTFKQQFKLTPQKYRAENRVSESEKNVLLE